MKEESLFFSKDMVDAVRHVSVTRRSFRGESYVHFHEFFEIELILGGRGKHLLNGTEYALSRGSVYLLTPADFHNVICEEPLELINIMFDETLFSEEILESVLRDRRVFCAHTEEATLLRLQTVVEMLMEECADEGAMGKRCVRSLMEYLLLYLLRQIDSAERTDAVTRFSDGALRYLYLHFRENPSVSEIAEVCGYTPNYFCKLFRKVTGRSYTDFLNTMKINHAKMLLTATKMTVTEIAFACGFTSLSNFYRIFRAETGEVPVEYRRERMRGEEQL